MPTQFLYPRPEYPLPDRQRGTVEGYDWLNLNGPWQFRFDGDKRGIDEKWFAPDELEWRGQIIVPFCWESLAAWGEGDAAGNDNYYATRVFRNPLEVTHENHRSALRYEVGWYRRLIEIPDNPAWRNKRVILTIGAADFFTDCWCNGIHLGHHEGGYTPFEFDLTDALIERWGETPSSPDLNRIGGKFSAGEASEPAKKKFALIVLRVEDPMDNREQPVGKQWRWYTTTSGIWQTVFVEPRSATQIKHFRIAGDIDRGVANFSIHCANAENDCAIEMEIFPPCRADATRQPSAHNGAPQRSSFKVTNGIAKGTVRLNSVQLWDPNTPNLYGVELRLRQDGQVFDQVRTYFGMRKVDFEYAQESGAPAALRLNGIVRYLRGALYQSYYPDGVYTASSLDVLRNDIAQAKKFGFNFLRVHIKVDDPLFYYCADQMGILLMADFPNFGEGGDTRLGRSRFETMLREAIERDFNHPSIFAWCLFNETWGFGGQVTFAEKLIGNTLLASSQSEDAPDPSFGHPLPVGREDGTSHATADFPRPQEWVQRMWELAKQLDSTRLVEDMSVCHWEHLEYYQHCDTDINSWHFYINDYEKAKAHIQKIVNSTFIGSSFNYVPGFKHKGQPLINSEYGGIGALDGDRDVSWSFKFLTNELRRYHQISAYIYTELHDVEWEYNGFLNYDRTPKEFGYDPRSVNESNALPIDSPPIRRVAPGELVRIEVASSHYSSRYYENVLLHWEMGAMDSHGRVHQDVGRGRVPIEFPHRRVAPAHAIELRAPDSTMLCKLLISACTAEGTNVGQNFVHLFVSGGYPPMREETQRGLILRGAPGEWSDAQWSGEMSDRDRARAEDACCGFGHGFFEWTIPLNGAEITKARRVKVLCEASSHRIDNPQTDADIFPTTLDISLNTVRVYHGVLRNHPHDARGVLSYLRGGVGGYGYLVHAFVENDLLKRVAGGIQNDSLRLRCAVAADAIPLGGLTIYGAECGRFPVCPTVIIEW